MRGDVSLPHCQHGVHNVKAFQVRLVDSSRLRRLLRGLRILRLSLQPLDGVVAQMSPQMRAWWIYWLQRMKQPGAPGPTVDTES